MKRLILIEKIDQLEMQIVSKKSITVVNDFFNLQSKPLNANEAYFTDSLRLRASWSFALEHENKTTKTWSRRKNKFLLERKEKNYIETTNRKQEEKVDETEKFNRSLVHSQW